MCPITTPADSNKDPFQLLLSSGLRTRIKDEITLIPEREKLLINLYYQHNLNLKEIGKVLSVCVGDGGDYG